jgi:hypothetical protein
MACYMLGGSLALPWISFSFGLVAHGLQDILPGLKMIALQLDPALLHGPTGAARGLEPSRKRWQVIAFGIDRANHGDQFSSGPFLEAEASGL